MKTRIATASTLILCALQPIRSHADISLAEYAFNIDGTISDSLLGDPVPAAVDLSAFDATTGLGSISFSLTGAGAHYFSTFLDHEIDEVDNTFFNEVGLVTGTPAAGQTWEIDEPDFSFGDIFSNFNAGTLDNSIGTTDPEDVSMALAWNFNLALDQIVHINLNVSESRPSSGFYLEQNDPDSEKSIFFSGLLSVTTPPPGVPEGGATMGLLFAGIAALTGFRPFKASKLLRQK
jgi:hypothetical protein